MLLLLLINECYYCYYSNIQEHRKPKYKRLKKKMFQIRPANFLIFKKKKNAILTKRKTVKFRF